MSPVSCLLRYVPTLYFKPYNFISFICYMLLRMFFYWNCNGYLLLCSKSLQNNWLTIKKLFIKNIKNIKKVSFNIDMVISFMYKYSIHFYCTCNFRTYYTYNWRNYMDPYFYFLFLLFH